MAPVCLSQSRISSPCAYNTLGPYSLARALLLRRKPERFESTHTVQLYIRLAVPKQEMVYVMLCFSYGDYKQTLFNFLAFNFFFKSQNISFLNSCCPFPVLCSLEDLGWGSTFANITVLQRAGRASCNWMRKIEVLCELKTLCRHCAFNQMFNFTVRIESHNHLVNFAISL